MQEFEQKLAAAVAQNAADREFFKEEMGKLREALQESSEREAALRAERWKTPSCSQPKERLATPVPASERDLAKAVNEVLSARDEIRTWREQEARSEQTLLQELGEAQMAERASGAEPQREDPEATPHLTREVEIFKDYAGGPRPTGTAVVGDILLPGVLVELVVKVAYGAQHIA